MTPVHPRAAAAALIPAVRTLAVLVLVAGVAGCAGGHHRRAARLPAGPQEMTATVDAVRVVVSGACGPTRTGAGLTDGHFALTSASLVAAGTTVQVSNAQGRQVAGRVVALDPDNDVAWVYAPGLPSTAIAPAVQSDRVVPAYLFTFGADGTPVTYRAQTLERTTTTTKDVFADHDVQRAVYRLHLDVRATAPVTGAPVLDSSGHLLGIATGVQGGDATTVDVVAGDVVAKSAATRSLSGQDPAAMATSAGTKCPAAMSASS